MMKQQNCLCASVALITALTANAQTRNMYWNGPASGASWDNVSQIWREGAANGPLAAFQNGDSAFFNLADNTSLALDGDISVGTLSIVAPWRAWTLSGAGTLTIADRLVSMPYPNSSGYVTTINTPRLSGAGAVVVNGSFFSIGNNANDFSGGFYVRQGTANASVDASGSGGGGGVLGAGDVALGDSSGILNATLNLNPAEAGAIFATPGDLVADGGINTAFLNFNDASGVGLAARFGGLRQDAAGANIVLSAPRATEDLLFDNPPQGVFPPWFVIAAGNGQSGSYAAYDPADGVVRAALTQNNYAVSTSSDYVYNTSGVTLSGDAYAAAVDMRNNINLNGRTLHLGSGGVAGFLHCNWGNASIHDNAGGGALDIGANELHVYNTVNSYINVPIRGTGGLHKFGSNNFYLNTAELPPRIVAQNGYVVVDPPADAVYSGEVRGVGSFQKSGTNTLTFAGNAAPIVVNNFYLYGTGQPAVLGERGTVVLNGGASVIGSLQTSRNAGFEVGGGALLTVTNNCALAGDGYNNAFKIDSGARVNSSVAFTFAGSGSFGECVIDNGTLSCAGGFSFGANAGAVSNRFDIINGSVVSVTASDTYIGNAGAHNIMTMRGSTFTASGIMQVGRGVRNEFWMLDGSAVTNNFFYVGNATASDNRAIVSNAHVRVNYSGSNGSIRIGENAAAFGNMLDIQDGGLVETPGSAYLGNNSHRNTLRLGAGGTFNNAQGVFIGWTSAATSNAVLLAGGQLNAGSLEIKANNILAVELQENGLPATANITGKAAFDPGAILRLSAVKNAPEGAYAVLTANGGITGAIDGATPDNIILDIAPSQQGCWKYYVRDKTLFARFSKQGSLLIIR